VQGPAARCAGTSPGFGGNGAGDPYFPLQGNTGYDVKHYWINLRYAPHRHQALSGDVRIRAKAHHALSRFNLDLRSAMTVHREAHGLVADHIFEVVEGS